LLQKLDNEFDALLVLNSIAKILQQKHSDSLISSLSFLTIHCALQAHDDSIKVGLLPFLLMKIRVETSPYSNVRERERERESGERRSK
jgi:hypothetical protein